ncbi:MAG: THUMP domain-containing protein [Phycisphaerales bacterium]
MQPPDPTKKRLTRLTCSPHVPPVLRTELEQLGFEVQEEDHVALHVGASLHDCYDLNLRLRSGLHVMWQLARFRCPSPDALYTHARAYPWEAVLPVDGYFSVTSNVDNPKINNSMFPNLKLKDAIVDRIASKAGARPDSGPDKSRAVVHLDWKGDRAWIYLNTTGKWLADRGYRRIPHLAPMRETTAGAVLLAMGYDGSAPLINPMCGAGTLAIEAALIATNRAPGLLRANFGVMHTLLHNDDAYQEARRRAHKQSRSTDIPPIVATDHDPKAIEAATKNAKVAGVDHLITFAVCDFRDSPMPGSGGHVVLNPEYGERLGEADALGSVYAGIGDFFKQRCAGRTGAVFTGSQDLAKQIGLRPSSRTPFMNAQIECRLLTYEMYEGSRVS